MKEFNTEDILTIVTGKQCNVGDCYLWYLGVQSLASYITSQDLPFLFTITAFPFCKEHLIKQYPQLEYVDTSNLSPMTYKEWITEIKKKFPETLPVLSIKECKSEFKQIGDLTTEIVQSWPNWKIKSMKSPVNWHNEVENKAYYKGELK